MVTKKFSTCVPYAASALACLIVFFSAIFAEASYLPVTGSNIGIGTSTPVGGLVIMNGNVGVGTWSPTVKLQVIGNVSVTDEAYGGGWDGSTNVPTKNAVYDQVQSLIVGGAGGWTDGGTNVYTSTTTDNVGIGTTTTNGASLLHVRRSQDTVTDVMIENPSTGTAAESSLTLRNDAGNSWFYMTGTNYSDAYRRNRLLLHSSAANPGISLLSAGDFRVTTNGATSADERMRITTDGNVGIGTDMASATGRLIVLGGNVGIGTTAPVGGLVVMNGNVGIGTWSPRARLEVVGSVLATSFVGDGSGLTNLPGALSGWSDPGPYVHLTTTSDLVAIGTIEPVASLEILRQGTNHPLMISNNPGGAGDFLIVRSSGNVGIGNVLANNKLTIGSAGGVAILGPDADPAGAGLTLGNQTAYQRIQSWAGSPLAINPEGNNVGIGTIAPVGMLDVRIDEVRIWTGAGTNSNAGAAGELYVEGDLEVDGTIFGDGSGLTNLPGGWTDGGTNVYTITTTDNVGIGTTTPASTLTVVGNIGIGTTTQYRTIAGPTNGMAIEGNIGVGTWASNNAKLTVLGGSVGIGTTKPEAYLHLNQEDGPGVLSYMEGLCDGCANPFELVNRTSQLDSLVGIRFAFGETNNTFGYIYGLNLTGADGAITFGTSDGGSVTEKMRINDTGNVGIGTISPVGALTVMNGNVGVGTWSPTSRLQVIGTVNATAFVGDGSGLTNLPNNGGWTDGGTNVYTSTTTDNVGIGTTTPSTTLEIVKQGTSPPLMVSATATGDGDYFMVTSSGNVGIGTTSPQHPLSVGPGGDVSLDGADTRAIFSNNGNTAVAVRDSTNNAELELWAGTLTGGGFGTAVGSRTTHAFQLVTDGLPKMHISSGGNVGIATTTPVGGTAIMNGNVGIGTWSPIGSLEVRGGSATRIWTGSGTNTNATAAGELYVEGDLEVDGTIYGDGSGITGNIPTAGGWTDGGANVYTSTTTDNVGIGTTTPTATLLVQNAGAGDSLRINDAVLDGSPFIIDASGNVGIGTYTPVLPLEAGQTVAHMSFANETQPYVVVEHTFGTGYSGTVSAFHTGGDTVAPFHAGVYGNATGNGMYGLIIATSHNSSWTSSTNALATGKYLGGIGLAGHTDGSNGTGTTMGASIIGQVDGTVSSGVLPTALIFNTSQTNSTGLTERLRINSAGNIGIGTDMTSASAKLSVLGGNVGIGTTAPVGGLVVMNGNVGIGTWSPTSRLQVIGTVNATAFVGDGSGLTNLPTSGGWTDGGTNVYTTTTTDNVGIGTTTPTAALLIENAGTQDSFRINDDVLDSSPFVVSNAGLVGIGTTTPVVGLHVNAIVAPQTKWTNANSGAGASDGFEVAMVTNDVTLWNYEGGYLRIGTNNAERFRIDSAGNVGLGTTTSVGALTVMNGNVGIGTWSANNKLSVIGAVGVGTTLPYRQLSGPEAGLFVEGNMGIGTWAAADKLIISGGNVGIGTLKPQSQIEMGGTLTASASNLILKKGYMPGVLQGAGTNSVQGYGLDVSPSIFPGGGSNSIFYGVYSSPLMSVVGGGATLYGVYSSPTLTNTTASTKVFSGVFLGGNVGVGTFEPNSRLVVNGGVGIGTYLNSTFINVTAPSGGLLVENNVGIGTTFPLGGLVVMNGNVGIGTWSPTSRLQVIGTVNATAFVGDGSGLTNLPTSGGWTDGGTNVYTSTTTDLVAIGTTTPASRLTLAGNMSLGTTLPYRTIAAPTDGMTVEGNMGIGTWATGSGKLVVLGGNVGIGTTNPGGLLSVGTGFNYGAPVAFITGTPDVTASAIGQILRINDISATGANTTFGGISFASDPGTDFVIGKKTNNSTTYFQIRDTASTELVTLDLGGNFGLSDTTPDARLEVVGSVFVSSTEAANGDRFFINGTSPGNVGIGTSEPVGGFVVMNGNVGIGTWSPTSRLQVIGTVNATAFVGDGSGLTNLPTSGGWTDGGTNVYTSTTTDNVGIGTTTPTSTLEVVKTAAGTAPLMVSTTATSDGNLLLIASDGNVGIGTTTPVGALTVMNGNVGVGTWSPRWGLEVNTTQSTGMAAVFRGSGGGSSIGYFWPSFGFNTYWNGGTDINLADGYSANMSMNPSTGRILIETSAGSASAGTANAVSPAMVILNNRNVAVGFVDPVNKFEVVGAVAIGSNYAGVNVAPTSGLLVEGNVGIGTVSANNAKLLVMGGNVGIGTTTPVGALSVMNGNVGIGTWSPEMPLHVIGHGNDVVRFQSSNGNANIQLYNDNNGINAGLGTIAGQFDFAARHNNTAALEIANIHGIYTGNGTTRTGELAIGTSNNAFPDERIRINSVGNVGIGTTSPRGALIVANGNMGIGTLDPVGALTVMNGNVGIGTWSPTSRLQVIGTVNATAFVGDGSGLTNLPSGGGWTDGGTNVYNTTTTDNVAIGTTTPVSKLTVKGGVGIGTITPYSTIAPPANGMTVNGNVGIGTWNPFSLLQVAGTIRADAIAGYSAADSNTNISISSDQIFFTIDGLGRGEWTNTYIDVPPQIRFDTDNSVGITYAGTDMISFYTADVDRLLINANGNVGIGTASPVGALTVMNGNVGIGTWSPTQRLQVVGTVSATAFVGDGSGLTGISAGGWTDGGTNVFTSTTTDNVGIGTTTPTAALLVQNAGTQSSFRVNDAVLDGSPFIIDSAGNVGIGTSTPGYHFRVYDTGNDLVVGYFQNAGGFAEINISNSTNAIKAGVDATTGWYTVEGNLPLTLGTNSTEKMRITSSGNVGIGTTTPVGGLTVMNGNVGIGTNVPKALVHIRAGGLSEQTLHPGSGGSAISYNTFYNGSNDKYLTSESAFSVFHDLSNDALRIMAAAVGTAGNNATYSDSMLFWSDGKVGIGGITGLAGMSSLLNVYSSSGAIAALKGVGDGTDFSALNLWSDEGTDLSWEMSHTQNPANTLAFNYYNGTTWSTKLTINNSGNVGVGTTTPVGGLTVLSGNVGIGTWSPTSRLQVIGTVNATAFVGDGSGLTGISAGGWTDGGTNVYTSTTTDNVGIGTTTPTAALLVENAGTQTSFRVNDAVADPSPFIIDAAGNVGVGTSGPLALVHVQETYTGGNVAHNMLYNYYSVQPSVDIDTSSYQYGNKTEMWFSGANDIGPWGSSAIYGLAYSNMDAAATSANVTGVRGSALQNGDGFTTDMTGVYAEATKANIGGVGNMFGVYSVATNQNTTNSVLGLYAGSFNAISTGSVASNSMGGVTASITVAAGATVVAAKGISTDVTNSGTITDAYGLYVGSVQGTNKWSMYASDAAAPSYFAGNVGLGTTAPVGALTVMSGNVGIGTWSPTQRLQVVGTVSATAFVGDGSGLTGISAGGWTDGGTNVYTSTTTDNVAIGTTTPVGKLTIKGGVGIGTITPYTSIAPPANGMIVDGNVGIGTWAVNSGKLIVMGGNVGIGTITPVGALTVMNGNVGIGTYSPVSLFDVGPFGGISGAGALPAYQASVNQQSATASDETLLLTNGGGLGRASSIQFRGSTSVSSNVFSTGRVVSGASGAGYATSYLTLGSASANNAFNNEMTLINGNVGIGTSVPVGGLTVMNGNVGIGTWSPRAKLEVIGSVLATSFYGDGSNLTNISSGGWNDGGTNVFTVTTTDNVAIGTTTPVNKLSVRGNVGIGSTVPYPTISAPLNGMVVEGNVGIGTWNPRTKLQVEISDTNGDSVLEAMRVVHTDNSGNGNDGIGVSLAFYNEDDAGRTRESADIISVLDASTDNAINASLRFHTMGPSAGAGVTAATEKMRLDATGNLGIGDTGPDAALEVVGAMMISGAAANNGERLIVTTAGNVGIGTNIPKSRFVVYGGVGIGTTGGTAFIATTAPAGGLIVQNSVGIGTTTPVGALTVMNGNVGIGTWSPRANLEVIGSVLATSFYGDGSNLTGISAGGWTDGGANVYTSVTTDNVGIGTTTPASTLTIAGNIGIGTYAAYRTIAGPNNGMILEGNIGIGTWNPRARLEINNTVSYTSIYDNGNSGTSLTVNWNNGNIQKVTMTGACTFTFTAPGGIAKVMLQLVQGGGGGFTASWPGTVKWPAASAPTLTSAAGSVDFVTCLYDGTNYYCTSSLDLR